MKTSGYLALLAVTAFSSNAFALGVDTDVDVGADANINTGHSHMGARSDTITHSNTAVRNESSVDNDRNSHLENNIEGDAGDIVYTHPDAELKTNTHLDVVHTDNSANVRGEIQTGIQD